MSTLMEWLEILIGEYEPISYVYDIANDVSVIPSGAAGVNWPWVASAALLVVAVWCMFALVGAIFGRK